MRLWRDGTRLALSVMALPLLSPLPIVALSLAFACLAVPRPGKGDAAL